MVLKLGKRKDQSTELAIVLQVMTTLKNKNISEISELIRSKQLSPVDLVTNCVARIKELNPALNAFITVLHDEAMKSASIAEKEISEGNWRGVLHGIPIAVKDFYDTAGIRTTAGFEKFKDRIPEKDAVIVKLLKKAGAILIGKTNMHKLGMGTTSVDSYFGSVHNSVNPEYVAGGSSGGSAVAVATGMCFATVDTDAVGSCRIPAACCGVMGFKASNGLINMEGILAGEKADEAIVQFSAVGITTRNVEDTEAMLNVLTNNQSKKNNATISLRIGVVQNFNGNKEINKSFLKVAEKLKGMEHEIISVEIPFDKAQFNIENLKKDRQAGNELLFSKADLLLLPTLNDYVPKIEEAKKIGDQAIAPANTFFCNYFGLPAISIPYGKDTKGFPLSFQVIGKPLQDYQVLDFAKRFSDQ
jgi:aspartyl-tRNA(Asn)/glutamyl-tRNA(Gln) amidotransferase subunit A